MLNAKDARILTETARAFACVQLAVDVEECIKQAANAGKNFCIVETEIQDSALEAKLRSPEVGYEVHINPTSYRIIW